MSSEYELPALVEDEVEYLEVFGARVHNLKNISLKIPRNKMTVITGLSGSGKSSLAFDTIFAEGQRRYMESFSNYARQYIGNIERPDVEYISGLSPVISIEQKTTNRNPRSTVGTTTELYDFLRLLYARLGEAYSYNTGERMARYSEEQIINYILEQYQEKSIVILAPLVRGRKGHYRELFQDLIKKGYLKVRVDGEIIEITPKLQLDRYKIHDIELVVDRLKVQEKDIQRIRASVKIALQMGNDLIFIQDYNTLQVKTFSKTLICPTTGISYEEPSPNTFSFNSPYGYCPTCKGLGVEKKADFNKIIPNDNLSIEQGGIVALGPYKSNHTYQTVKNIIERNGDHLNTPLNQLSQQSIDNLMYGVNSENNISIIEKNNKKYLVRFEGIIPQIERNYQIEGSDALKNWASNYISDYPCSGCHGHRLKKESLFFKIDGLNISEVAEKDLSIFFEWLESLDNYFKNNSAIIAKDILKELKERTQFLLEVGLGYLALNRASGSLSGGESQRIRLASQIGSQLMGITYILDEPSIGLHQRDNNRLIKSLRNLTNIGNTVIVVEHDKDIMLAADYIIDLGPGAGEYGGEIVGQGTPKTFLDSNTITSNYLKNIEKILIPSNRRKGNNHFIHLKGATGNNLKNVDLKIPLGTLTCICGVSGSGKSTLITDTLYPILNQHIYHSPNNPLPYTSIEGLEAIDKVIEIDQAPIGKTPRSNPATYTGVFDYIRALYAQLPESQIRGYKQGRFSFNVKGGRCEECHGGGKKLIEMNFLPDVYVECTKCLGKRYNRETLEIKYKHNNIYQVLEMTISEAAHFFEAIPQISRKLKTLVDVGLGYIKVGQSATTLSGGEAQRVKLAEELSKRDTGNTIYILDEPTTGLHFEDIRVLLDVLQKLVDRGNTVIIIEHNLDVIKVADYVVDIGPEGGRNGGKIVAEGTPEEIVKSKKSITGQYLKHELA
ncbi:MAG: excinuclease ABC subunit UvrA [Chitinophagales bacterium]|nr:excinuclease ABC subunit UvrA [Chitinophagales bacterium]MCZ2394829.1 excinuclease ABC subunit UvrA [Chitinophagales bacterium]